jgi:putative addiction module CopG family antidote
MRQLQLTDALDRFIEARVASGQYQDASEVMREALLYLGARRAGV